MEIVIASHSVHKIREFRDMFKSFKHIDVLSLLNFPHYKLPEETGSTFKENAVQKAVDAAKSLNKWVLADDSGLVVPHLNGEPGIYSRRYAGLDATDAENRQKLLSKIQHLSEDKRNCYFECYLVLANADGVKKIVSATCEGTLITEERGSHGFGYDCIFIKEGYGNKTFGQLPESTKNRISHRRKAFEKLITTFETL